MCNVKPAAQICTWKSFYCSWRSPRSQGGKNTSLAGRDPKMNPCSAFLSEIFWICKFYLFHNRSIHFLCFISHSTSAANQRITKAFNLNMKCLTSNTWLWTKAMTGRKAKQQQLSTPTLSADGTNIHHHHLQRPPKSVFRQLLPDSLPPQFPYTGLFKQKNAT